MGHRTDVTDDVTVRWRMNTFLLLLIGGLIGWLASLFMKTENREGLILNLVIATVGAFLGNWLLGGLVFASLGAIVVLAAATVARRSLA